MSRAVGYPNDAFELHLFIFFSLGYSMSYSGVQEDPLVRGQGRRRLRRGNLSYFSTYDHQGTISLDFPGREKVHVDRNRGSVPRNPKQILFEEKMMPLNPCSSRNIFSCLGNGFVLNKCS